MGLDNCAIILDNQCGAYHPGQTISGRIEYTFDNIKKVRGIYVIFNGIAKTDYEDDNDNDPIIYTSNEEYFNISYYILGGKNGDAIEIPIGTNSYPFKFVLPSSLPSCFEGEYGFVRYTIRACLDRPGKTDEGTEISYSVVSQMDLNTMPECKTPIKIEMKKNVCCCWCKSGPLIVDIFLPVSGYCPGQAMPIDINVENGSNVSVCDIEINLVKKVKFYGHTPEGSFENFKEIEEIIEKISVDFIPKNTTKYFSKNLEIPLLAPSNLEKCSLIDISYKIEVKCSLDGCHLDMDDSYPITMGTIPFFDYQPPSSTAEITTKPSIPQYNLNSFLVPPSLQNQPYEQPGYPLQPNPAPYMPTNPPFNPQFPSQYHPRKPSDETFHSPNALQMENDYKKKKSMDEAPSPQVQLSEKTFHYNAGDEHTKKSGSPEITPYPKLGFVIPN